MVRLVVYRQSSPLTSCSPVLISVTIWRQKHFNGYVYTKFVTQVRQAFYLLSCGTSSRATFVASLGSNHDGILPGVLFPKQAIMTHFLCYTKARTGDKASIESKVTCMNKSTMTRTSCYQYKG